MGIKSLFSGLDESGMVGKSEIIVSAEIQDLFAVGFDLRPLWGGNNSLSLVSAGLFHEGNFLGEDLFQESSSWCGH